MRLLSRWLPTGWPTSVLLLRVLLFALPVGALMVALPEVPHWAAIVLVTACALDWAREPDSVSGTVALVLVMGWWTAHGVVDWRLLVVAALLVGAHVLATVLAHGPGTLRVDPALARLWAGRAALSLLPMGAAYATVRGLDPELAPGWLWMLAALVAVALMLAASRVTQVEAE